MWLVPGAVRPCRDLDTLMARAQKGWRDGYRATLAIRPAQVDVINAAFAPTQSGYR